MDRFPIPTVLECMHFVCASSGENRRTVRDYEFDLYVGGEREMYLNGTHHHIQKGTLVFRKPGQRMISYGNYDMYLLTLDFSAAAHPTPYTRSSAAPEQPHCPLDVLEHIPSVFTPLHQHELRELYRNLAQCSSPNVVDRAQQQQYVTEFLFLVLADAYHHRHPSVETAVENPHVRAACQHIRQHYAEPLTVDGLADRLSINKNHLIRLFNTTLHTTPNRYLNDIRLQNARQMLVQTDLSIQRIAQTCGFNTVSYFIKRFKEQFGECPSVFRNTI